ncbi:MAG: glutathione synthase [Deltaproteobacteria bacterium]|nr:MAG: glutathione synthase [Deltaproteobacteria bacterium]
MPARRRVLVVSDPPETFDPRADSTYLMIVEALHRGLEPYVATLDGLRLDGTRAVARAHRVAPKAPGDRLERAPEAELFGLDTCHAVLMRKDPPVDDAYLTATWILDQAKRATRVVNDPNGLRTLNEKLSILSFPDLVPPTYILRRIADLRALLRQLGGRMIVKPVFGFAGREILLAREDDPNLGTILEIATADETRWTVAQAYLPEAAEGDKRILLVDGRPIGAVLRVPKDGEIRDNFHAGGTPARTELTSRDLEICARVGPFLVEHGQYFAGIDVIGGYLTEINVTSPTGMQEIDRLEERPPERRCAALFWDGLAPQ